MQFVAVRMQATHMQFILVSLASHVMNSYTTPLLVTFIRSFSIFFLYFFCHIMRIIQAFRMHSSSFSEMFGCACDVLLLMLSHRFVTRYTSLHTLRYFLLRTHTHTHTFYSETSTQFYQMYSLDEYTFGRYNSTLYVALSLDSSICGAL